MKAFNFKFIILIVLILLAGLLSYSLVLKKTSTKLNSNQISSTLPTSSSPTLSNQTPDNNSKIISEPISNALARVTKKPFGIKVSPTHSPVSPECFSGYHAGVDFETTAEEQNIDVPIFAICTGPLALKKYVSGYGGVAAQQCKIDKIDVTVIYGHLKLSSITPKIDGIINAGEQIAVLGKGYSSETDGERKHLHLGIHKGTNINILGYVQKQEDLKDWIDSLTLLK
jgi:hypothetical protein